MYRDSSTKVFLNAGAASKTNLLFFTKGEPTKEIWYYDLSDINITKKQPLTLEHFEEFFKLLNAEFGRRNKDIPQSAIEIPQSSWRSWLVPIEEIESKNYDFKAVNPNRKEREDSRTPEELLSIIESQNKEILNILDVLQTKDSRHWTDRLKGTVRRAHRNDFESGIYKFYVIRLD